MKVIGFNASPRKNGNTACVINKILEKSNIVTKFYNFADLNIKPCQGCLGCHKNGINGCVINDDMQKLYKELENADTLILGTPIYMGQMTAQAKTFIDRLFAHILPRFSPHYKEKKKKTKLIFVFTQGNPDKNKFQVYIEYTKHMFQLLEFDVREIIIVSGTRTKAASEQEELQKYLDNMDLSF
jgi:multimeric flavodoxin WrbA